MDISGKTYIFGMIGMAILIYLIGFATGDGIADWAREQQYEAAIRGQGIIEKVVFVPLEFTFDADTRLWGALIAGLLWPLVFVWMFLIIVGLIVISVVDATTMTEGVPTGY